MSEVAKNLASFADKITAGSVSELSEAEIAQVSGGMEYYDFSLAADAIV